MRFGLPLVVLSAPLAMLVWLGLWSQSGPVAGDPLRAQLAVGVPLPLWWLVMSIAVGAIAARDARTVRLLVVPQEWWRHSLRSIVTWSVTALGLVAVVHFTLATWAGNHDPVYSSGSVWAWLIVCSPAPAVVAGSWVIGAKLRSWYGGPVAGVVVAAVIFADAMYLTVMPILTVQNNMMMAGQRPDTTACAAFLGVWGVAAGVLVWVANLSVLPRASRTVQVLCVYGALCLLVIGGRAVQPSVPTLFGAPSANTECVQAENFRVCGPSGTRGYIESDLPTLNAAAKVMADMDVPLQDAYFFHTPGNALADMPVVDIVDSSDPNREQATFDVVTGIAVPRSCPQFKDDSHGPQWLDGATKFSTAVTQVVEGSKTSFSAKEKQDLSDLGNALSRCEAVPTS